MKRLVALLVIVAFTFELRQLGPPQLGDAGAALLLGFVLLASYVAGGLAAILGLPRLSGYVLFGVAVGPFALDIVGREAVAALRTIDDLALALIALTAGGELRVGGIRRNLRPILSIAGLVMFITAAGIAVLVLAARPFLAVLEGVPLPVAVGVAVLLGIWCANSSPDVTVAVINESGARGPVTDTILTVTILKDVLVIICFAIVLSLTAAAADPARGFDAGLVLQIGWEVGGALAVGGIAGWGFSVYLQNTRGRRVVATFAFTYVLIVLVQVLHVELLLTAVAAGFVIENFSRAGDALIHGIEANGLPIYAVFFAIAGAGLDLAALLRFWPLALAVVLARLAFTWAGARLGGRIAGAPPPVLRFTWLGLVSQAGVTLGLSLLVGRELPRVGATFVAVTAAIIVFHLLLGPVLLQRALQRSGEAGGDAQESRPGAQPATAS